MSTSSEALFCTICNQPVTLDMDFCLSCGYPVKAEDAPPPRGHLEAVRRPSAPRRRESPPASRLQRPSPTSHETPAVPPPRGIRYTPGGEPITKGRDSLYVPVLPGENSASDKAHVLFNEPTRRPLLWPALITIVIVGFLGAVGFLGYNMAKVEFYGVEDSIEVLDLARGSAAVSDAVNLSQQLAITMQTAPENVPFQPIVFKPREGILLYPIYSKLGGGYSTEQVSLRLSAGSTVNGAIKPFNYGFCMVVSNSGTVAILDETGFHEGWTRCDLRTGVASP